MTDETHDASKDEPVATTNQPINAEPRPRWSGFVAVIGLVVVLALVFAAITWTRYNT